MQPKTTETHRTPPQSLSAVVRSYRWQLRKWPLHTQRFSRITVKALVTSNIIQSVYLVGKGRLKERCGLEPRTDYVFRLRNRQKLVRIRFENIRYITHVAKHTYILLWCHLKCRKWIFPVELRLPKLHQRHFVYLNPVDIFV
jgi:hypothetical protein